MRTCSLGACHEDLGKHCGAALCTFIPPYKETRLDRKAGEPLRRLHRGGQETGGMLQHTQIHPPLPICVSQVFGPLLSALNPNYTANRSNVRAAVFFI